MESPNKKVKIIVPEIDFESIGSSDNSESSNMIKSGAPSKRSPKTTDMQYEKIIAVMQSHVNQKLAEDQWDSLTLALNAVGPPFHTKPQWKKVWTDYQRNQSIRATSSLVTSQVTTPEEELSLNPNTDSSRPSLQEDMNSSNNSEIIKRLDLLIEQQSRLTDLVEGFLRLFKENFVVVNVS